MNKLRQPPVKSMQDLTTRKQILRLKIEQKEKEIGMDYKGLVDTLTFRNLFTSLTGELAASGPLFYRALIIGRFLVDRWKKKRQKKRSAGKQ